MDLRVIGGGAAALAFGAGGFSYVSVGDVLSEEVRDVRKMQGDELQAYMDSIVTEMDDAYDYFAVEGETFAFVGDVSFAADASTTTFSEAIVSEEELSKSDRKMVANEFKAWSYCESEDVTIFTEKGYDYHVTIRDGKGTLVVREICKAPRLQLRPTPSV
jgi:hypothetical protein